jgi:hypothetical protein
VPAERPVPTVCGVSTAPPRWTGRLLDPAGEAIRDPIDLAALGNRLYAVSGDFGINRQVWVTDGTPAGTTKLVGD